MTVGNDNIALAHAPTNPPRAKANANSNSRNGSPNKKQQQTEKQQCDLHTISEKKANSIMA